MQKTKELILLLVLMTSCVNLVGCALNRDQQPIVVIKGVDYDDGKNNTEPKDKTKWMWITYDTAKRQLHWLNHR